MTTTLTDKYAREAAYLQAHATAFQASEHLTGRARLSGLSDADARAQLNQAGREVDRIISGMKPVK